MTKEEFDQFEHESHEYLKSQQEILKSKFKIGGYERWDYHQETGEFIFSDKGVPKVIASFQIVGSLSNISQTWLWSWANPSILNCVKKDLIIVKEFGEENNLPELIKPKWLANELDAWAMTNVAAKLLNAKGAYKCPDESGSMFVIFTEIKRVLSE